MRELFMSMKDRFFPMLVVTIILLTWIALGQPHLFQ